MPLELCMMLVSLVQDREIALVEGCLERLDLVDRRLMVASQARVQRAGGIEFDFALVDLGAKCCELAAPRRGRRHVPPDQRRGEHAPT